MPVTSHLCDLRMMRLRTGDRLILTPDTPGRSTNPMCTIYDRRLAGYTASDIRGVGYTVSELTRAGYTLDALGAAGFTARDVRAAECTASDVRGAGIQFLEMKYTFNFAL
jgi:hypothetical protein